MSETVDLTKLRAQFAPELLGKLPRVTCRACSDGRCGDHKKVKCAECNNWISERHIHLDYVGHADVTDRLLDVDPEWDWQPKATDPDPDLLKAAVASGDPEIVRQVIENAPPKFETDRNGNPVGLWIKLTVGGKTRLGYGSCPSSQGDAEKVLIGDALRNAALRFGVATYLWAKGDRADPTAENATASAGQASRRGGAQSASDAFENATPAPPRQNGAQHGQVSRPAQPPAADSPPSETAPEDIDLDAQAFADEAHGAITLHEMEDIHRRAREAGKLTKFVRNPSAAAGTGKPGKLAIYLDWKRRQVKETEDALGELNTVVDETGFPVAELETHVKSVTGTDLESASAAQLRQAAQAMRVMQGVAA
jgi:hypothetical protein